MIVYLLNASEKNGPLANRVLSRELFQLLMAAKAAKTDIPVITD